MPVPEVFAAYIGNQLVDSKFNTISLKDIQGKKDFFIKTIYGECGDGVKYFSNVFEKDLSDLLSMSNSEFIFQERVSQHEEMNRINPKAVNTIRLVTILQNGKPVFYKAILRVGTKRSEECDNTSKGGIACGIDEKGKLMEYGFTKPSFGGRTRIHPDSKVEFSLFDIPFYKESINLALKAHRLFYRVKSIGWDIAITPEGPLFIEGNDNWELQTIQAIYGGQREVLEKLML